MNALIYILFYFSILRLYKPVLWVCLSFLPLQSKYVYSVSEGPSWSWLYGSWIYNYLCNQCLSLVHLGVWILFIARGARYNIMW